MASLHVPFQPLPLRLDAPVSPCQDCTRPRLSPWAQGLCHTSGGGTEGEYFRSVASVSLLGKLGGKRASQLRATALGFILRLSEPPSPPPIPAHWPWDLNLSTPPLPHVESRGKHGSLESSPEDSVR